MSRRCTRFIIIVVLVIICVALISVINVGELSVAAASGVYGEKSTSYSKSGMRFNASERTGRFSNDNMSSFYRKSKYTMGYELKVNLSLDSCQAVPDLLVGRLKIDFEAALKSAPPPAAHDVLPGGAWSPNSCVARQRIAIIIPFRDRQKHLDILLYYLVPVLTRQQVAFQVFVVEQYGNKAFNKGRLMNIGFTEARKHDEFDCFIFHDVDLIPEDDRNMYTCSENPRHMSPAVDKLGYKLPYKALVGGVLSIKPEHYSRVNGYSNLYWGWGAEDDDMYYRLSASKISVLRPPFTIGRYKMIKHDRKEVSPAKVRYYLLRTVRKRFLKDGLNTLEYRLVDTRLEKLYTRIVADVGDPPKNSDKISAFVT
ncbi:beta-1,4-N-acetylgalactosaminyltransferase bre-4-like isoform X1 [Mya arenaria]|uniref:beta-1,4-N-acetylgalactosaminyltransferase bre-4-like isoform X1 n=1 Tax=Mya arenaria TaxID=6604 RepID=UPI0022E36DE9|nr:beta-1,4-N-acetylgalactosaminyltransferase bre-4-like isoform X1 [Mya arenaria]XP_052811169.1 beta-1,4-N-acetylgalactosaminyltransferase bre-4-like isoform X1 [Mya arenaria]